MQLLRFVGGPNHGEDYPVPDNKTLVPAHWGKHFPVSQRFREHCFNVFYQLGMIAAPGTKDAPGVTLAFFLGRPGGDGSDVAQQLLEAVRNINQENNDDHVHG